MPNTINDVVSLNKTIFIHSLIRVNPQNNLAKKFHLKIGEKIEVKLRYKNNKTYVTQLLGVKNGKRKSPVYNLNIPPQILEAIKKDFYYSYAKVKNAATTNGKSIQTDELLSIKFPLNKKDPFRLGILVQNNLFHEIKNLLIADQSFTRYSIEGKLIKHHSGWRKRTDLTKIKPLVEWPTIYYLADKNYEQFYIGQCINGLSRLTDKGQHPGTYMKKWEHFRYTEYYLDKTQKKHRELLDEIEKDHIKSFSRQVETPKVPTAKGYSINVFYSKSIASKQKPIKLNNKKGINDK